MGGRDSLNCCKVYHHCLHNSPLRCPQHLTELLWGLQEQTQSQLLQCPAQMPQDTVRLVLNQDQLCLPCLFTPYFYCAETQCSTYASSKLLYNLFDVYMRYNNRSATIFNLCKAHEDMKTRFLFYSQLYTILNVLHVSS